MKWTLPAAGLVLAIALVGCAPVVEESERPTPTPTASVSNAELVPGSTLDRSAITAAVPDGAALSVVAPSDAGEEERAALAAVQDAAIRHGATVQVHAEADPVAAVRAALAEHADVVVGIGPAAVGALDRASAANLDVSFLLLGTQLAEPTGNVIAVTWPGAEERAVFAEDPAPFSGGAAYAGAALEIGLAAFASGLGGHVIALD